MLKAISLTLALLCLSTSAQARGWDWFVHHIKSSPHCAGHPTTYYGEGRRNADGSRFERSGLSAATYDYPFGTVLAVTNCANGQSVMVTVKDRGPGTHQRDLGIRLDLSLGAARAIALGQNGRFESGYTTWSVVSRGDGLRAYAQARPSKHRSVQVAQATPSDYMARFGAGF